MLGRVGEGDIIPGTDTETLGLLDQQGLRKLPNEPEDNPEKNDFKNTKGNQRFRIGSPLPQPSARIPGERNAQYLKSVDSRGDSRKRLGGRGQEIQKCNSAGLSLSKKTNSQV